MIHNLLNNIFNKHLSEIYKNNKIIRSGISEQQLLYYKFKYSEGTTTKQNIVASLNFDNNNRFHETSYYRKEKNISLETYKNILIDIQNLYLDYNGNKNKTSLIAVDGTYGNTNIKRKKGKLQTSLFMGYYDITNNIPIDINFKMNNCNNEVETSQKWFKTFNNLNYTNYIIIADRAYFKYEFFEFLIRNNIKFIIRIRNNAKPNQKINEKCRFLKKVFPVEKQVYNNKNKRKEFIICNNEYSLITNLTSDEYNDESIYNMYNERWEIEVFFKYIKSNYKLQNLKEKRKIDNDKLLTCHMIIIYIAKLFKKYFLNKNKATMPTTINKKNNVNSTCKIKINETLLAKGIFEKLLMNIICGNLTEIIVENFTDIYLKSLKNEINRSFDRVSLIPFTKWYVKKYLSLYKYKKIYEALSSGNIEDLNKNLKSKATTKSIK